MFFDAPLGRLRAGGVKAPRLAVVRVGPTVAALRFQTSASGEPVDEFLTVEAKTEAAQLSGALSQNRAGHLSYHARRLPATRRARTAGPLSVDYYKAIVDAMLKRIEAHTGRLTLVPGVRTGTTTVPGRLADTGYPCRIKVYTNHLDGYPRVDQEFALAHELGHCLQFLYDGLYPHQLPWTSRVSRLGSPPRW
jgi:hypothetical protein